MTKRRMAKCIRCKLVRTIAAREHCHTCYAKMREEERAAAAADTVKAVSRQAVKAAPSPRAEPAAPPARWHEVDRIIAIAKATNVPVERALEPGRLREVLLEAVRTISEAAAGVPHTHVVVRLNGEDPPSHDIQVVTDKSELQAEA